MISTKAPHFDTLLHRRGGNKSYLPFLVVCDARTGSNWFCSLLASHPNIVSYLELFNPRGIYHGLPMSPQTRPYELKMRDLFPQLYAKWAVYRGYEGSVMAVGMKLLYNDLPSYNGLLLKYLNTLPALKIIHLRRRNAIASFVSNELAQSTGVWSSYQHSDSDRTIFVDTAYLMEYLKDFLVRLENTEKYLANRSMLTIWYEDLLEDSTKELLRSQSFLNVPIHPLQSPFQRLETRKLSDIIENFPEVKNVFKGSAWEACFDE